MATGLNVQKQDTVMDFDDRGRPVERVRVQFMVDDDGPFFKTFDKATFAGFDARQQLETFAREVRALRGA